MKHKILKLFLGLILSILTSCSSSPSNTIPTSNTDYKNIIGAPIEIGNLEVAQFDFPSGMMNWDEATAACSKLGPGWRLPTVDELNILYKNKDRIGGFKGKFYWSSTEIGSFNACFQLFSTGYRNVHAKYITNYVRAIKSY